MHSKLNNTCMIILAAMLFGCGTLPMSESERLEKQERHEKQELINALRSQFNKVHTSIEERRIDEAEIYLKSLSDKDFDKMGMPNFTMEYKMLEKTIKEARELFDLKTANAVTEKRILQETDERISLPETYGKTIIIDAKLPSPEIPEGKMESVFNKDVSITLDNAGIAELVGALREVCKLNVIADDAITADKTLTLAVENAPLHEILTYISRNMGIAFHLGQNVVWITKSNEKQEGPLLETQIIRLRQGRIPKVPQGGPGAPGAQTGGAGSIDVIEDTELEEALAAVLSDSPEGATYKIFRDRNILVIRDTRENIRLAEKVIKEFDKPPQQVAIEARFITISQDDLKDIGAEITQKNQVPYHEPSNHAKAKTVNMLTSLAALGEGASDGVGLINFSGVLENRTYDILISAISKKNSAVTLSVPRVTVMNNRPARIRKGEKLYYFEEYDLKTVDNKSTNIIGNTTTWSDNVLVPSGSPTELPIGLTFDVNVNIGNDGKTVMLGLKPEIVEFRKWEDYITSGDDDDDDSSSSSTSDSGLSQIKLPRTYEKSVVTTVGVASGQTVVLGGMLENNRQKTVKKVPLLGDIPLLGFLFRHEEITHTPINLLIFITATVINDKGEYVIVADEEESK